MPDIEAIDYIKAACDMVEIVHLSPKGELGRAMVARLRELATAAAEAQREACARKVMLESRQWREHGHKNYERILELVANETVRATPLITAGESEGA